MHLFRYAGQGELNQVFFVKHTYIQVYIYTFIHVHLQRSISIPCVLFRVAISSEGTDDADSSAIYVLAFLGFMHSRVYVCVFVYA
jgi:hypothetical protein